MRSSVWSGVAAQLGGRLSTPAAFICSVLSAALVGSLASVVVAFIAHQAGVSSDFQALHAATFISIIVFAVLVGATGWHLIRDRAPNSKSLLDRLVPVVLVLSFIPDVLLHVVGAAYATWGAVTALMVMHVFVAAAAVASYRLFLPVYPALLVDSTVR